MTNPETTLQIDLERSKQYLIQSAVLSGSDREKWLKKIDNQHQELQLIVTELDKHRDEHLFIETYMSELERNLGLYVSLFVVQGQLQAAGPWKVGLLSSAMSLDEYLAHSVRIGKKLMRMGNSKNK